MHYKPNPRYAIVCTISDIGDPKIVKETVSHVGWLNAMKEDSQTLESIHI